ncbi:TetR/AcrR family transcriptional regulator [Aeromicrobium sp. CTD01-1L150]|uniref:TetR/AcrR family transcriptional regulator n=1 Tax=Aeromicrobium sp. CTD01-1L150 TaxID=3341830 RepID=UPI0035C05FDF
MTGPYHTGLTAATVIDAAVQLTHDHGLYGWSVRDLGRELDVAPSVVYHHVGGRELLCREVVERVVADLGVPDADLAWDAWFREVLLSAHQLLSDYPGTAKWLLMHGPVFEHLLPIVDTGMAVLQRDGFDDEAPWVYASLFNTVVLTLVGRDERSAHEDDGPRDHAAMMADFTALSHGHPGVRDLADGALAPLVESTHDTARLHREYVEFLVDSLIDGLRLRLTPV